MARVSVLIFLCLCAILVVEAQVNCPDPSAERFTEWCGKSEHNCMDKPCENPNAKCCPCTGGTKGVCFHGSK